MPELWSVTDSCSNFESVTDSCSNFETPHCL